MKLNIPATGAKPLGKNSSEPTSLSTAPFRSPASGTRPGPPPQSPTLANVSQIISKVSFLIFLSSGSKCVTPLLPPTRHNLVPVWDKNNPPGRLDNECLLTSVMSGHGSMLTYKCSTGGLHNRLTSDFNLDTYNLTCLPENRFSIPTWPTCAASITQV